MVRICPAFWAGNMYSNHCKCSKETSGDEKVNVNGLVSVCLKRGYTLVGNFMQFQFMMPSGNQA
jgi:hypothetical protein